MVLGIPEIDTKYLIEFLYYVCVGFNSFKHKTKNLLAVDC